jgi:Mn2+/Fe2+ NRAMP family transporter
MAQSQAITLAEFRRSFGPGLIWAGAAIGVSHLVQSTRAGATSGYALTGVILAALLIKYPFFEFGPRYAAATGESLVDGYRRIGAWALWVYFLITLITAVIIDATIALFAGFLFLATIGLEPSGVVPAAASLYAASALLLWRGRFQVLDASIKVILIALSVSTLVAAAVAFPRADLSTLALLPPLGPEGRTSLAFTLALAGWMPSAIDVAVWSSLWTLAKDRAVGVRTRVVTAQADFLVGYVGTGVLAFAFVTLGAAVMYGSGRSFSPEGAAFSLQLADLYAATLGGWARPFVLVAALTTMLSTLLAVVDGFPRALDRSVAVMKGPVGAGHDDTGRVYWVALVGFGVLTVLLLGAFGGTLTALVDFATIVSFLTAPVLGYLNLRVVTGPAMPRAHRPGPAMLAFSYAGLAVLATFGAVYLVAGR